MLFDQKNYVASAEETKSLILSDIIDLALHINFLECTLSLAGDAALAAVAAQKAAALSVIFELWPGIEILRHVSKAVSESNVDGEVEHLTALIQSNEASKGKAYLSTCPLFDNVVLGGKDKVSATGGDYVADFLELINNLT